jgi:copper chaperone CopZ
VKIVRRLSTTLGVILSVVLLGCGGSSQKTTVPRVEGEESTQSSVQTQLPASQEEGKKTLGGPGESLKTSQVTLKVDGMHCGGCTKHVKDSLLELDGVKKAEINLEKGEALVDYIPEKVTKEKMVEEVTKTGYKASLP